MMVVPGSAGHLEARPAQAKRKVDEMRREIGISTTELVSEAGAKRGKRLRVEEEQKQKAKK